MHDNSVMCFSLTQTPTTQLIMMKTIRSYCIIVIMFLVAVTCWGTTNLTYTARTAGYDKYLSESSGLKFYEGPVIQTDITVFHNPSGLAFNIWHCTGLDNGDLNNDMGLYDDEIDYTISLNRPLSKTNRVFGSLGACYFNEPDLSKHGAGDIWLFFLSLTKTVNIGNQEINLSLSPKLYVPNPGTHLQGERLLTVGAGTKFQVFDYLSIPLYTDFGVVSDGFGVEGGFRWMGKISLEWKPFKRFPLTVNLPSYQEFVPLGWNDFHHERVLGGFVSYTF